MPSESPWLLDLQGSPGWVVMQEAMNKEKKATWQQTLAVHTSMCCQVGKADSAVPSLEEAGLRNTLTDPGSGQFAVELSNLLPAVDWTIKSSWHDDVKKAKEEVCFDTLTFMLMLAPHTVKLHPNSLSHGVESIVHLRELGQSMFFADNSLKAQFEGSPPAEPLGHRETAACSPTTGGVASDGAASSPPTGATTAEKEASSPPTGATTAEKEAQVEALLRTNCGGGPDKWNNPSHLKSHVFLGLKELLPKKGLRRFLEARPTLFQIRDTNKQWEFRCL